ncbi:MAG: rRNA maturation RNase YbeY [Kiritimatiellae bacterium]|nr:rRNA maturation RNase YbeY [Kiritimatiellia bacterium]
MKCHVTVDGALPRALGISRAELRSAAAFFAAKSSARVGEPFRAVSVVLQDDEFSAEVHVAVNGAEGPTDVVTQRYDAMPGEEPGVYGELYVNVDQAMRAAPRRSGWSPAKELLLYVAHGMDHLSGADDLDAESQARMRRRELRWLRQCGAALRPSAAPSPFRTRGSRGPRPRAFS